MDTLIGRVQEINSLQSILESKDSEMVAVIGRRRVGKTFLVQSVYETHICFAMTGTQTAPLKQQLHNFALQMAHFANSAVPLATPASWAEAFHQLSTYIDAKKFKQKKVIFIDELPWLATHKSGFLSALGYFWNSWASRKNIVLVICGSAASWMIEKVVHHKGGLHNRITKLISLEPFTLAETNEYLMSRKVSLNHYQIVQLYMAMGGIPHYLKEVKPGLSAVQNIDAICFKKNGLLRNEFSQLYPALFDNSENHMTIIRALASKWKGLTRKEVVNIGKLPDGGRVSKYLTELDYSGFISTYLPFGKSKKDAMYRLTDEYSLFYLKFIENSRISSWLKLSQLPVWKSWSGYAFENVCLKHINLIKQALGISGVYTENSSYWFKGNDKDQGFQIDLLIDRQDQSINLCEMKFSDSEFNIDKAYAKILRERVSQFKARTKTKKHVFVTFVTTFGLKQNSHSIGLINHDITMDALFLKP